MPLLYRFGPSLFRNDIEVLRQIGRVSSMNNLVAEVRDLRNDYVRRKDFGLLRKTFKMRLSGDRILSAAKPLWNPRSHQREKVTGEIK